MPPPGYRAAIERALPGTLEQLAEKSGMRLTLVRKWIRVMRTDGGCHVGAWEGVAGGRGKASVAQVFVAGPGQDVPPVAGSKKAVTIVLTRDRGRHIVASALPGTREQLVAKTRLSKGTICRWIKVLHAEGEAHIVDWKRSPIKGPFMPVFAAGAGVDAVCTLANFTTAEKAQRYRGKARNTGTWAERTRQVRARYWANKAAEQGDPLINALFGKGRAATKEDV